MIGFIRLTKFGGEPVLVNTAWVTHAETCSDGTTKTTPQVTLWLGNEYGESGSQMSLDVQGTLDEIERLLTGQVTEP